MPTIPKTRSPNYPGIDLEAAVAKLRELFSKTARHAVGSTVAIQGMGYSPKSSSGMVALAALRAFGLLEDVKQGKDSMVKVSNRGLDIAVDFKEGSDDWQQAIKAAAVSPRIHNELWTRYGPTLPMDDELRRFLVREKGFGDAAVGSFISEYKATIAYAKLTGDDTIKSGNEDDAEDSGMNATLEPPPEVGQRGGKLPPAPAGGPFISFPLSNGNAVEIRLRQRVSPKDFERIKTLVELSEASLVDDTDE